MFFTIWNNSMERHRLILRLVLFLENLGYWFQSSPLIFQGLHHQLQTLNPTLKFRFIIKNNKIAGIHLINLGF